MMKISEDSYLKIRSLAYALDRSMLEITGSNCDELETASILSLLLVEEMQKVDKERKKDETAF